MEKIRSPLSQGGKKPFLRIAYVLAVELHIFIYTTPQQPELCDLFAYIV
ncbi:MAG: hypothetical protein ACOYIF_12700 [Acetivibrionales bacterium]|jgi:hypothetical protein